MAEQSIRTEIAPPEESRATRTTKRLLLVLTLTFESATLGAGQQTSPADQQRARELLRALNARDTVALRRFVDANLLTSGTGVPTSEVRVTRLLTIRTDLGPRDFQRTDTGAANDYVASSWPG